MVEKNATNVHWHAGHVERAKREQLLGQQGATLWFTGLSASGKSTVAFHLEHALIERGRLAYVLDGDNIRHGLNKNLGFSPEDRTENIRRIGEVAKLFADTGVILLASFISPYQQDRDAARQLHEEASLPFFEVHVSTSLEECERRDPKGLYKKARAGEIPRFTGISAPYEVPTSPEVTLDAGALSLDETTEKLLAFLESREVI